MFLKNPSDKDFITVFYKDIMPKIYGIGASVVIAGAMFKLLNLPGGALMLGVGLTTEAIIFFLGAFEPQEKPLDWTKAYPELLEEKAEGGRRGGGSVGEKLDAMFAKAKLDAALVERLGSGMQQLSNAVEGMADMSNTSVAMERYVESVEKVSDMLQKMGTVNEEVMESVQKMANLSGCAQSYYEQMQKITENLQALNATYTGELQSARDRTETTEAIQGNIGASMKRMEEAGEVAEKFKDGLVQLNDQVASLNSIYGTMLMALKK